MKHKKSILYILIIFSLFILSGLMMSFALSTTRELEDIPCDQRQFKSEKDRNIQPDIVLWVNDQFSFEKLQNTLEKTIWAGKKSIEVRFTAGTYSFKHRHIDFEKNNLPDVSIRFVGRNSRFIPQGRKVQRRVELDYPLDYHHSYLTFDGSNINLWTPFYNTDTLIQVVEKKEMLCRIHVPSEISLDLSDRSFIQYTEWYYTRICKIDSIRDNYVYFKVPELFSVKETYNVNYDYVWHKKMPRFRFFDTKEALNNLYFNGDSLQEGQAGTLCRLRDSKFKSISFEDIRVDGNNALYALFSVKNCQFDNYFLLYNSLFNGQRGNVAYLSNCQNTFVQNCRFLNQYSTIIDSDRLSSHTEICGNYFENCGLGMTNSICSRCSGRDYLMCDNTYINFGYCAIAVGVWYQHDHPNPSCGVVEHNVMYNTDDYLKNIDQRGLIDGGAIYLSTINDNAVIRYNFINNIGGAGSNRGIYCDDGAKNFSLFGNIVLNVLNSNCIDARYDAVLEDFDKKQVANINKVMEYNIIDGKLKFQGKPIPSNGCIKINNFLIRKAGSQSLQTLSNLDKSGDDEELSIKKVRGSKIVVDRKTRRTLKSTPIFKKIKRYITVW